jgi:hypothetical protein
MELPFPRFTHRRMEPDSSQLVLLFPSAVSAHGASSLDSADEFLGDIRRMGDRKNE